MNVPITPLHVRSGYSLLRGTALPGRVIDRAVSAGYARLAMTDVNGLYGATVFDRLARRAGLAPILGAEFQDGAAGVVALVEDDTGYENLCRIITRIHRRLEAVAAGEGGKEAAGRCASPEGTEAFGRGRKPPEQGSHRNQSPEGAKERHVAESLSPLRGLTESGRVTG
ncbi:MAG TPA: PHP domain-containing protein, partial [Phycisphaerae bacterium]|nr:PHP domain-containing protein [Phycisphaerae bacterium]